MILRTGFFCSTSDNRLTTNRKIKLQNLSYDNVLKTFIKNLADLKSLLEYSKNHGFKIFRIGSNLIPFFSHEKFKDSWKYEIEDILKKEKHTIKNYGIRLTMHPGQYVVLNSPEPKVVKQSIAELEYHAFVLDTLETDLNSIIIIHVGGKYGNKEKSIERFINTIEKYPNIKRRLAIENDDKTYSVRDVLQISKYTGIPVVFDYYHHMLNFSEFDLDELIQTWKDRIPKFHISSQGKKKYQHSEYLEKQDFTNFIEFLSPLMKSDITIDIMPEVKMKEKSSLIILNWIREHKT